MTPMKILQVSEFIEIVNGILRESMSGEVFAVEGEVSGFKVSQGQWVTFDLKDEKSLVNIFIPLRQLGVLVQDGMRVRVFGLPRVYPKFGKFSVTAERIELAGEGAIKKALALLRQKLEKEGIFDPARKRSLPRFPRRVALVASRESAAYGDFIRIVGERWGGLEIDLYHVLVQGDKAPQEIVAAIEQANLSSSRASHVKRDETRDPSMDPGSVAGMTKKYYDVLVMTRGGGSLEELMAFNDERVVRAVYGSRIPTLVAIGHERDLTLAEEAADVRGSTPTDCARRLVPDRRDVLYELATLAENIETAVSQELEARQAVLERALAAPGLWLAGRKAELDSLAGNIWSGVEVWLRDLGAELAASLRLLQSLDPKGVLKRGYAMLKDAAGHSVASVSKLNVGKEVAIVMQDGDAGAKITRVGKIVAARSPDSRSGRRGSLCQEIQPKLL